MGMIYILRKYIMAERTGNWALHLQTIQNMLPYLALRVRDNGVTSPVVAAANASLY